MPSLIMCVWTERAAHLALKHPSSAIKLFFIKFVTLQMPETVLPVCWSWAGLVRSYLLHPQVCVFASGSTAFWSAALVSEFSDSVKQAGEHRLSHAHRKSLYCCVQLMHGSLRNDQVKRIKHVPKFVWRTKTLSFPHVWVSFTHWRTIKLYLAR